MMNEILAAWRWNGSVSEPVPYGEGHINQTYALTVTSAQGAKRYILQKINTDTFKDPAGFMKSVPMEIEEAAMIDGCNPIQIFFKVVFPILKPTMISTAILETMWVWNDYLLPTLVLDIKKYRTIPMAIQYFRGGYGRVELAPMMACIIIAIIPIIILYMTCQKYIIEGVVAGAVKG